MGERSRRKTKGEHEQVKKRKRSSREGKGEGVEKKKMETVIMVHSGCE